MKTILWTVSLLLVICGCTPKPTEVVSPDGHIRLQFALDDHNRMTYRIDVDDTAFVAPSALGFLAGKGVNLSEGMKVVGTEFSAADETWTQPWGENKSIRNHYNEMAVCLSDEADTKLTLRFRVFDDGVGFRYEYEVAGVDSIFVTDELTSFNMAQDGISWSIPANYETYELLYRTQPLSKTDNANTPMTFKVGKTYASIHEAALTDFPEMTLQNTGGCGFKSELAPWRQFQYALAYCTDSFESCGTDKFSTYPELKRTLRFGVYRLDSPDEVCRYMVGHASGCGELGDKRPPRRHYRKCKTLY